MLASHLAEMASVSGTNWAVGIAARSEALLAEDRASRRSSTSRRSIDSVDLGWRSISLVPTSSTASG